MSQKFNLTFQKLLQTPLKPVLAKRLRDVAKEIDSKRDEVIKSMEKELVERYATKDESGAIERPKGNPNGFDVHIDKRKAYEEDLDLWGKTELSIEARSLQAHELEGVKLSAEDLIILDPIVS